jgi:hypothetical protein
VKRRAASIGVVFVAFLKYGHARPAAQTAAE